MKYEIVTGTWDDALSDLYANGGQLYARAKKNTNYTIVRGGNCVTYWEPGSKRRQELRELGAFFGHPDPEILTGGRLCRYLWDNIIECPYKGTPWGKRWRKLAMGGKHWHYLFVVPNEPCWGVEIDIKSAYYSQLLNGKSLIWGDWKGFTKDGGNIQNLHELTPHLPKWLRLQLLGTAASWRRTYAKPTKDDKGANSLSYVNISNIAYGGLFNATHRAILGNYLTLKHLHSIGGEYVKRIHTDSLFLSYDIPLATVEQLLAFLNANNLRFSVKCAGKAIFFDVNTGCIGRQTIGSAGEVQPRLWDIAWRYGELSESKGKLRELVDYLQQYEPRKLHRVPKSLQIQNFAALSTCCGTSDESYSL